MTRPRISIAMATFNGERFLQEQLDSFIAQTRRPDELVVTDDCSTDGTVAILDEFKRTAPFDVRIYCNERNLGFAKNFERAISLCAGDIIFLSDQDDVWLSRKIDASVSAFNSHSEISVVTNDAILTDGSLNHKNRTLLRNIRLSGQGNATFITGCCTSIRRTFLDLALPIPPNLSHDYWINGLADALRCRLILSTPLQLFRRHDFTSTEWIVATPQRVGLMHAFRLHGLADVRSQWRDRIQRTLLLRDRIFEKRLCLSDLGMNDGGACAIEQIDREIGAIQARINILNERHWRRWVGVLRLFASRQYGYFAGWKSALKDIVRP